MTALGRLQQVDLRTAWQGEATHFTPWLAQSDNLSLLSETLGLGVDGLDLEAVERNVGPFRADIVCREVGFDSLVLIENQLGRTDHGHLGQLITYAAGLQAATIVRIAARVTDEHRAAIDWLNEITSERFRFFALEVELWRIGDSLPAPKFNCVATPNDWSRRFGAIARGGEGARESARGSFRFAYWSALLERPGADAIGFQRQNASPYLVARLGRGGFHIAAAISFQKSRVAVEFLLLDDSLKLGFDHLFARRAEIERDYGAPLEWHRLDGLPRSRICETLPPVDPRDEDDWPRQHDWLIARLSSMRSTFGARLSEIPKDGDGEDAP